MATTQPRGGQILDQTIKLDTPNQDVTGTLPVGNGGTGNATNTLNSLLVGNGSGAILALAPSTTGQVAVSNGTAWASSSSGVVLTDPKINAIKDTNGNTALALTATASAVNYLANINGATGEPVQVYATGSDSDVILLLRPRGTSGSAGFVSIVDGGATNVAQFRSDTTPVNYWRFFSSNAGTALGMYATGSDPNLSINFVPKGTGFLQANGVPVVAVAAGTAGNVPTSDGAGGWTSTAPSGGSGEDFAFFAA